MAQLVPVDNDPFAVQAQPPQLVPVDHDPFSAPATPPIDAAQIAETINRQFAPDKVAPGGLSGVIAEGNAVPAINSPQAQAQAREFGSAGYYLTPAEAEDARTRSGWGQFVSPPGGWSGAARRVGTSLSDQGRALGSMFGLGDRAAAVLEGDGATYNERLAQNQQATADAMQRLGVLGKVQAGVGDTLGAMAMTPQAIVAGGTSLLGRMGYGALGGAGVGAVGGAASTPANATWQEMGQNAATGAGVGGATGFITPAAVAGVSKVAEAIGARLPGGAGRTAKAEVARAVGRSGKTAEEIAADINAAKADGQDAYTLADALGNPGQRLLSTAARTPNDDRAALIEFLDARQAGQGRRVANALQEASGTNRTAAQTAADLKAARDAQANTDYTALRTLMGDAPIWGADLQALTSRPSVRAAIDEAKNIGAERGYSVTNPFKAAEDGTLSLPEGTAPNFTFWDTVKRGLDQQIARDPTNRDLVATKNALTGILDKQVKGYAEARAPFAAASRAMEAVDIGAAAAKRGRVEDTIPAFDKMSPAEQQAFRAGYFDPLIEGAQGAAEGVNKARPLLNDATAAEFPAFAAPGQADKLATRLGREKTMFETRAQATGGSKTADNLADKRDFGTADFDVVRQILSGDLPAFLRSVGPRAINEARGLSPSALSKVSQALRDRNPDAVREMLTKAANSNDAKVKQQAVVSALLTNMAMNERPEQSPTVRALLGIGR